MDEDERLTRYNRDGSVTLIQGAREEVLPATPGSAEIDAAAAAFFDAED